MLPRMKICGFLGCVFRRQPRRTSSKTAGTAVLLSTNHVAHEYRISDFGVIDVRIAGERKRPRRKWAGAAIGLWFLGDSCPVLFSDRPRRGRRGRHARVRELPFADFRSINHSAAAAEWWLGGMICLAKAATAEQGEMDDGFLNP